MMDYLQDKIRGILLGAITGDAIGTPLDGLTRAHIHSVFKNIGNYTDPEKALKGKINNWRKPCLYSSISQLMILLCLYLSGAKRWQTQAFIQLIGEAPDASENEFGIFRHPDIMIKFFLKSAKSGLDSTNELIAIPGAANAVILIPVAIQNLKSYESFIMNMLYFSQTLTKNIDSMAGSLIFNLILRRVISESISLSADIVSIAVDELASLLKVNDLYDAKIFEYGMNPDYFVSSIKDYRNILIKIEKITNMDDAEKIIYNYLNTKIKTPVTRATVNHPLSLIPFSIYLVKYFSDIPSNILFCAGECGGSASILCALAGALTGAVNGTEWIPHILLDNLINKKRIFTIIDAIINGKVSKELINEFLQSEISLTQKESQEKNAKLKHVKIKQKKNKTRKEYEKELSSHVVESWTKIEKARWRRKIEKDKKETGNS